MKKEVKYSQVAFRVTEEEKQMVLAAAALQRRTLSQYCRILVLDQVAADLNKQKES